MKTEITTEAIKAAPPIAAWAMTLNETVAIATAVYIVVQVAYLLRKWWREEKDWEAKK